MNTDEQIELIHATLAPLAPGSVCVDVSDWNHIDIDQTRARKWSICLIIDGWSLNGCQQFHGLEPHALLEDALQFLNEYNMKKGQK